MGKLKKLSLSKKYLNKCSKEFFLDYINHNKISCKVKKTTKDEVIFLTNERITEENIACYDRYKYYVKYLFVKHLTGVLTFILAILILFLSGSFIREITFVDSNEYNEEIYQEVKGYLVKKGFLYVLEDDVNYLSAKLKQNHPEFAWIGLTKNYSQLLIDIEYQDVPQKEENLDNYPCDLVSKFDGIIEGIVVKKGVVLVGPNQSVKKGDVLVSGNLNVETDPNNTTNLVKSEGIIIGKTLVLEKIKVWKKSENLEYTGCVKNVKVASIFNKTIGKNPLTFDNYNTEVHTVFNLFNIFKITNITYFEQQVVERIYDEKLATEYAISQIYKNFQKQQTSELEKIDNIKLIEITTYEDYYEVSFVVSKHVNFVSIRQY